MLRDDTQLFRHGGRDPLYGRIRDEPHLDEHRRYAQRLWERFRPYADSNFLSASADHFHPRYWEMCLADQLLQRGHRLEARGDLVGPDLLIVADQHPRRVWVEAIAPDGGTGADAVAEPPNNVAISVPADKVVLRLTSAFA